LFDTTSKNFAWGISEKIPFDLRVDCLIISDKPESDSGRIVCHSKNTIFIFAVDSGAMVSEKTLNSDILGSYVHYYSFVRL
jgi:hypothetical protein